MLLNLRVLLRQVPMAIESCAVGMNFRRTIRHSSYGEKWAVDDVRSEAERGKIFALLGPNGAGKTTTIEILEEFRGRSAGEVETAHGDRVGPGVRPPGQVGMAARKGRARGQGGWRGCGSCSTSPAIMHRHMAGRT
jgi:ABC-type glutathione transport system ATPase component